MRPAVVIAALAAATSFYGVSLAQDIDLMQFADADKDGKVTLQEYTAFSDQGWGFFSQGADKIKLADLDPQMKPFFAAYTPDADGNITKDAYMAKVPGRFKAADTNGDGVLSADELNATMKPPAGAPATNATQ